MAVRAFAGSGVSSSRILFSPGTIPGTLDAAWSILFVARNMGGANFKTFLSFGAAGGPLLEFYLHGADSIGYENGGGENYTPSPVMQSTKNWCLVAFTKASGSAAVRGHVGDYQSNTWVHQNTSGSLGNITTTITGVYLGYSPRYDYSSLANPVRYAAAALFEGTALTDAAIEGLTTRYPSWLDLAPTSAWRLNQTAAATAVVDDTGGGADQASTSNTTVVANDDPPGWDPELSPTGIHRVDVRGLANPAVSGTTSTAVDMPTGGSIATASYLIARLALDNSGVNGDAVTLGVTDPRGNTWTMVGPANQDPGAANAGVTCYMAYARVDNAYSDGDDLTFTYTGGSVPAKAIVVEEWTGIDATTPIAVAVTTATGTGTTLSISRTPTATDQVVLTALAVEGPAADTITQDDDTIDGTWGVLSKLGTTAATATNNVTVHGAWKKASGTSAQTWNPTLGTSRDWAALALVLASTSTAIEVEADGTSHGHTADEPTLIQTVELVSADAAHSHTADSPALAQVHAAAVDSTAHGQTAAGPDLAQLHALSPDSASHQLTTTPPTLGQVQDLTAADDGHAHVAGEPQLNQTHQLTADPSAHGHAADEPSVSQAHAVDADGATHGHVAAEPAVAQAHAIAVENDAHAQVAEQAAVAQQHVLAVADATHPHAAAQPDVMQGQVVAADGAGHAHTVAGPALVQVHQLTPEGATHEQVAAQPSLTQTHQLLAADAAHSHVGSTPDITGAAILVVDPAIHAHLAAQAALTQLHQLTAQDAIHGQVAGSAPVTTPTGTMAVLGPATVYSTTAASATRSTTGTVGVRSTTAEVIVR